ncbi:TspO and MBR related proteins [Geodermatophilus telluris]|uniref:TspO and MBR related proteins n=1 Tax=Geodermatophilus telluris TaxID=1190417 RepID=A0A1G6QLW7_9ACTN|nr:tryptophan-rich sensory protein [Geodermatophilus telluris]SDC93390.1 TspO and MBR related proteins [Geodermatophilus telluris]
MLQASACAGGAAVAGNAFIGKPAMAWFRGLTAPRWQLPMPAFLGVGVAYYGVIGYVLARSIDRRDARSTAWSLAVLVGNESWNGVFFGRRSTRAGFVGLCSFLLPLAALQRSVAGDPRARLVLAPYTAYVLLYDLPWTYRLWRLNPARHSGTRDRRAGPGTASRRGRCAGTGAGGRRRHRGHALDLPRRVG